MLAFYFDHNVPRAIADGVRDRGVDVMTAFQDGHHHAADSVLLRRASDLGRTLFTMDDDLLAEAAALQHQGREFSGVIYLHQRRAQIGRSIEELVYIAASLNEDEMRNQVIFLPL